MLCIFFFFATSNMNRLIILGYLEKYYYNAIFQLSFKE